MLKFFLRGLQVCSTRAPPRAPPLLRSSHKTFFCAFVTGRSATVALEGCKLASRVEKYESLNAHFFFSGEFEVNIKFF